VTCIDIDSNAGLLLSGYKNGSVALWDLLEYKLLKYIPSLHDTEVSVVKIYEVLNNGGSIKAVTSEDQGGVRHLEINKKAIFGGYNHTSEYLFKSKLKGTTAIAVYESSS
jgi:WD40 repeat protein